MTKYSDQLDEYWQAIVLEDDKRAAQIESAMESNDDGDLLGVVDVLQQLYQTRKTLEETLRAHDELPRGERIDNYTVSDVIGRGGMGVVYRVQQAGLDRSVALKTIRGDTRNPSRAVRRFREEASAIARLKHPGIVAIHEIGEHDGYVFFTMDLVSGGSVAERLKSKPMNPDEATRLMAKVASAIHFAHEQNILHRDIKPSNILLDEKGEPFVSDFGLAFDFGNDRDQSRLTQTGSIIGTPNYLSPEQATGKTDLQSAATDVYGMGATLYEMLCGRPPFTSENLWDTLRQIVRDEPLPPRMLNPAVPEDLNNICLKCLDKDPDHRYGTAQELSNDLNRYLRGQPVHAKPIGTMTKVVKWCRREPRLAFLLGSLATLLSILTTVSIGWSLSLNAAQEKTRKAEIAANDSATIAQIERDNALAMLNKLVFDIHAELQAEPGNLRAREQLLQVAVEGYEKLLSEQVFDRTPVHGIITAHTRLADVLVLLGREPQAIDNYKTAIQLASDAQYESHDGQLDIAKAEAHLKLGSLERALGALEGADGARSQIRLASDTMNRLDLAEIDRLGARRLHYDIQFADGVVAEDLRSSRAIFEQLLREIDSEDSGETPQKNLWLKSVVLGALINVCCNEFDMASAADYVARFESCYEQIQARALPVPFDSEQNPAMVFRILGNYMLRTNDPVQAERYLRKSIEIAEPLLEVHSDNVQLALDSATSFSQFAMVQLSSNKLAEADQAWQQAIRIVEGLEGYEGSVIARSTLAAPYVFRMELATRRFDFESAEKHCRRARDLMASLEAEGQLNNPVLISALPQTRRLLKAFPLVPKAIDNLDSVDQYDAPLAAVLLVYCCNFFENENELEPLLTAGDKLLALKPDDSYQFAIHMNSLARAYCRLAQRQPRDSSVRSELIERAFSALERFLELNPKTIINGISVEPDLQMLKQEPGYEDLVRKYQSAIKSIDE